MYYPDQFCVAEQTAFYFVLLDVLQNKKGNSVEKYIQTLTALAPPAFSLRAFNLAFLCFASSSMTHCQCLGWLLGFNTFTFEYSFARFAFIPQNNYYVSNKNKASLFCDSFEMPFILTYIILHSCEGMML